MLPPSQSHLFQLLFWLILGLLLGCSGKEHQQSGPENNPATATVTEPPKPSLQQDTLLRVGGHTVELLIPTGNWKGNLLLLPGWNYTRRSWCENSRICDSARREGYLLILPEMMRSMYTYQEYPETRQDLRGYPQMPWFSQHLLPKLQQEFSILLPEQFNCVLGLSSGGRGVGMMAVEFPDIFAAGAALSGDFDLTAMPNERLNILTWGPYKTFPERWEGKANISRRLESWKMAIYLGHGQKDKVVPFSETKNFYNKLTQRYPELPVELHLPPEAEHNYTYWDSEIPAVLGFFHQQWERKSR